MMNTYASIDMRAAQWGRIRAFKHARLYGPFITETQMRMWFEFGLDEKLPKGNASRMAGLLVLREHFRDAKNLQGVQMIYAAMVQIADRIRAVKQEIRKQMKRTAPYAEAA